MEKILEIAKEITNPYSLLALTYLILFLLFRGVLNRTGVQEGRSGFRIIRYLMTLVAVVSVLTLLAVFGLRAYEIYRQSNLAQVFHEGVTEIKGEIQKASSPDLQIDFHVSDFTGAGMLIGNQGQGIIIMSDLAIHWGYRKCPRFERPRAGAPLVEYRYQVELTTSDGSQLLDSREFKYGPGDVDKFRVDLDFPTYGIYTIWMSFKHRYLGEQKMHIYETKRDERRVCEK